MTQQNDQNKGADSRDSPEMPQNQERELMLDDIHQLLMELFRTQQMIMQHLKNRRLQHHYRRLTRSIWYLSLTLAAVVVIQLVTVILLVIVLIRTLN